MDSLFDRCSTSHQQILLVNTMYDEVSIQMTITDKAELDAYLREARAMHHKALAEAIINASALLSRGLKKLFSVKANFQRQQSFGTLLGH